MDKKLFKQYIRDPFRRLFATNTENLAAVGNGFIELRRVSRIYQSAAGDFAALAAVDLTIPGGEFVAIVGKSGSGKSTLINMITGIDRPSEGEVIVGGVPIHRLNENEMAQWRGRNVGVVFQFFQLLPTLSVLENIMLPMDFCRCYQPEEREGRARSLLAMVDMHNQADKLPAALSGGQQQRVGHRPGVGQ